MEQFDRRLVIGLRGGCLQRKSLEVLVNNDMVVLGDLGLEGASFLGLNHVQLLLSLHLLVSKQRLIELVKSSLALLQSLLLLLLLNRLHLVLELLLLVQVLVVNDGRSRRPLLEVLLVHMAGIAWVVVVRRSLH